MYRSASVLAAFLVFSVFVFTTQSKAQQAVEKEAFVKKSQKVQAIDVDVVLKKAESP